MTNLAQNTGTNNTKDVVKFKRQTTPIELYIKEPTEIEGQPVYTIDELKPDKMYIKINPLAYVYADKNRNIFKLLSGFYLEVETDHLFNNQYNTAKFRVFDSQISEVVNDVRQKYCVNKYTGKMLEIGKESEYLAEEKAKVNTACQTCFWHQKRQEGETQKTVIKTETQTTETETRNYIKECTYKTGCTHEEAEKAGFEYFTKENTYFLKYPKGINIEKENRERIEIEKGIYLEYVSGFDMYSIFPLRNKLWFKWYGGNEYYLTNGIGFQKVNKLPVGEARHKKIVKALNNF